MWQTMPPLLRVEHLNVTHAAGQSVLSDIHFSVGERECLAIVGPNGSGKSTLLRALLHDPPPASGGVWLGGKPLAQLSRRQRARRMALMSQHDAPNLTLTVEEYVSLGCLPHVDVLSSSALQDTVAQVLEDTGLWRLRLRKLAALSGGERQRAFLARALAQRPEVLLLDEPTNHLDPLGRAALLALVKQRGIAVVAVLHDLSLVEPFADRVLVLCRGRQVSWDVPARALASECIYPVFGVHSFTVPHPHTGRPLRLFDVPAGTSGFITRGTL
ncbi:ABC transporter related [Dickeya chrysanthemi Ech1591]|uniref:ABC transporter related n=1 Tax=Dickeya chrysanthemi (strain Ech1591) TaxID=561229 RepID=C6CKM2_DICC1|nr:ABC transporter ATP-binding protein [Dickeya chrysanthemi]ACT08386.1 ABC transporter related [Dickeya chrysanthemi Ech1591]